MPNKPFQTIANFVVSSRLLSFEKFTKFMLLQSKDQTPER